MTSMDCDAAREAMPDVVDGRASPEAGAALERHVASCDPCRSEMGLVQLLRATRPEPAPGLQGRILRSLAFDRQAMQRPWWALTAAAVAALALGIGFSSGPVADVVAPAFALEADEAWPWGEEGGLVAGAPVFDDLSDDALEMLLADLASDAGVQ